MENKLLSYILQMQKQSSTQSVPKLPKAQTGKTMFSFKDYGSNINTLSNDNIPRKPAFAKEFEQRQAFYKQQKERELKELQEREFNNRSYISQDRSTPASRAADKQRFLEAKRQEAMANSPLAQTFGSLTPGGYNPGAGAIAASQFVKTMPLIAGTAAGATALPSIIAGLNAPIAGVAGLTGNNIMNAAFAYEAAKNLPNVSRSIKTAYQKPTLNNVGNATAETALTALDALPFAAEASKGVKPIINKIGNAYNTVATGESALPIAWKSSAKRLSQEASADMFRGLSNANKLSDADRALLLEYQYDSRPFTGRMYGEGLSPLNQTKQDALNNIIKNNELNINNNAILTRRFNPTNQSLGAEFESGRLNLGNRPSSFSAGVGLPSYASGAVDRLVVPNRYAKQMGSNLLANEYGIPSDKTFNLLNDKNKNWAASIGVNPTDMINAEREVIGTGLDFRRIGKVKNDIGGYDHIVRPRNITKSTGTQSITRGPINWWESPKHIKNNPNFNHEAYLNAFPQKFTVEDLPDELKPFMERDLTKEQWKAFDSEQRRLRTNYKLGYDKYENGGYYDCPDQEKDPVTGKCKAEVVRGREAAAANKAANADMNAWAKQVAAIDKANAQQDAAQYAGQLGFDYDWMQSPVDKAEKKAAMAGYKQFFQQNPNTFVPDDTSGFSPEQKYIIASKLKQKTSTPMGSKAFQQKFNQDPRFMDLGRIQSDIVPTMGGWPAVRNWMFNNKAYGGPIVDPRGQWAHPGKVTRIPSSNITMQGVPYPVLGVASSGQQVMMQPNQNYNFDNAEYVDEYPMMANGGYTVTRSNDRKGKTHKVVGPDGTVKYFGDSNLGQHPKDPERKAAFYARHKKNLDANPYFRAFARKTWKEGGETGEDKEMLEGVADILRRVNDVNNRKQLAKYMMNNFREEDVTFEPNQFLKSANAFKEGGEMIRRADGSYSRRGLWDNIRANKGSGKKPSKQMLEQERKINSMQGGGQKPAIKYKAVNPDDLPHFSQWNPKPGEKEAMAAAFQKQLEDNDKYRDNDGMLESILEFVDPTGVSSWDDVARSFRNPLGSNWDRAFNLFSAIPIVGKIGKIGKGAKAVSVAGKVATKPGVFKKVGNAALKGIDVLTGGPAMRYFDQTINPISRGFGAISGKAVQQIPYSGVRKVWGIGSDFNQMRRFQDGVISPAFNQFDNFMTQPPNNPNKK